MVWTTPKTDWTPVDGVADEDFNRIEANLLHLYNLLMTGGDLTGLINIAGPKGLRIGQWLVLSAGTNGHILLGHNCYIDRTDGSKYKFAYTHSAIGARGIVMQFGSTVIKSFTYTGSTTADAEFSPTLYDLFTNAGGTISGNLSVTGNVTISGGIDVKARYAVTSGSSTAYTVSLSPAPASLYTGLMVTIKLHTATGTNPTLNVNGLGAKAMYANATDRFEGDAGSVYTFVYDGTNFILASGGGWVKHTFTDYVFGNSMYRVTSPITALSDPSTGLSGTSIGGYALFAGGWYSSGGYNNYLSSVNAYNNSLTRSSPSSLSVGRLGMASATFNNYAWFGGGHRYTPSGSDPTYYSNVDIYNTSLSRATFNVDTARSYMAAARAGTSYLLFAGGYYYNSGTYTGSVFNNVAVFNTTNTLTSATALGTARSHLAGASVGSYAIFAGGNASPNTVAVATAAVDAYSASLVKSTPTSLSVARWGAVGASIGNYALIAGGNTASTTFSNVVDCYNTSLVRSTATSLRASASGLDSTNLWKYVVIGGRTVMDAYDASLTRVLLTTLPNDRRELAAASTADYMIFAGGYDGALGHVNSVTAYKKYDPDFTMSFLPGTKYDFGSGEVTVTAPTTITLTNPLNGYIKYKRGAYTT